LRIVLVLVNRLRNSCSVTPVTTISVPIVIVWRLRLSSSFVSSSIVSCVAVCGSDGFPPAVLIITEPGVSVVRLLPFTVIVRWSPCSKMAMIVLPKTLIRAMPPRTDTEPVGV